MKDLVIKMKENIYQIQSDLILVNAAVGSEVVVSVFIQNGVAEL